MLGIGVTSLAKLTLRSVYMVSQLTWHDVFIEDMYIVASVRSSVLMPESNHVTQFMNHDTELITVLSD